MEQRVERGARPGRRDFSLFWLGQWCSALGDTFATLTVPLLVLDVDPSISRMGLVSASQGAGSLLAAVLFGDVVDRVSRRRLMISTDLARAVLWMLLPIGWWCIGPRLWQLYVAVFLGGGLNMLFGVAYNAALPEIVRRDELTTVNSRLLAGYAVARVLGPALAGVLLTRWGPVAVLSGNAASFLVSTLTLSSVRFRYARGGASAASMSRSDDGGRPLSRAARLRIGYDFLFGHPILRTTTLLALATSVVTGGFSELLIYRVKHEMRQGDVDVGIALGLAGAGAIAAGVMTPALRRWMGFRALWVHAMALAAAALALGVGVRTAAAIGAVAVLFTFATEARAIVSMSLRQELTPNEKLGRVTASFLVLVQIAVPLGAAAVTALAEVAGTSTTLGLMAGATAVLGGIARRALGRAAGLEP